MSLDWEYTKKHVLDYVKKLKSREKQKTLGLRLNLTSESKPVVNTDKDGNFLIYNNDRKYKGD
ncbi:hypothetical protein [Acinetobacter phage HFM1]|nr:hypothetical protein [Acinetobacter phage HFM1]